jgi:hypothetical protein
MPKKSNLWHEHIRKTARILNVSYMCAIPTASKTYKGQKDVKPVSTEVRDKFLKKKQELSRSRESRASESFGQFIPPQTDREQRISYVDDILTKRKKVESPVMKRPQRIVKSTDNMFI